MLLRSRYREENRSHNRGRRLQAQGPRGSIEITKCAVRHFHISHNSPYLHPPPPQKKKCIRIVFNFPWDDCNTQGEWKTRVMHFVLEGGGGGAGRSGAGRANKVPYGKCRSGVFSEQTTPPSTSKPRVGTGKFARLSFGIPAFEWSLKFPSA